MDRLISATEANRDFSSLLGKVAAGESFIVTSHGKPVARFAPLAKAAVEKDIVAARRAHIVSLRARGSGKALPRLSREDFYD